MSPVMLAVLLGASGTVTDRLLDSEVAAGVGVLGAGSTSRGALWGDWLVAPTASARGVFSGFVVEGGVYAASPLVAGGVGTSFDAALRVGWSGRRWALVGGVNVQWTPGATPAWAPLPTARLDVALGPVGLTLGVLDWLGLVPAHLDVRWGPLTVGWVAPIGLLASGDISLPRGFGLRASGFAFMLGNLRTAMVCLSGTWGLP